ncbi:MAG: S8 family serine peptidase, partial [Candidatus Hydrogenedentes bacterium]|nr:S8 family serine peptidase [Candidatus Hydrogenedentota bacterium]
MSTFPIRRPDQVRNIRQLGKSPARRAFLLVTVCLVLLAVPRCSSGGGDGSGPAGSTTGSLPQDVLPIGDLLSGGQSRIVQPTATETVQLRNGLFVEVARDEILIALKPDVTRAEIAVIEVAIAANFGVIYGDDTDFRLLQVRITSDRSENDFVDALDVMPGVLDAYLNITVEVEQLAPGSPTPDHFAGSYWIDQIRAREAWQTPKNDSGMTMTIGIIDSGFNPSANVLDATRIKRIDVDGLTLLGDTDGFTGHGTAVTAFAAGDGDRDDNSVGVAWLNDIVNVDMFEETFPGTTYVTTLLSAIRQAIEKGSQIVNIGVGPSPMLALNPGLETNFLAHRIVFRDAVAPALHYARRNNALPV